MSFKADLERIQTEARKHMMEGAVTPSYGSQRDEVCRVLNDILATEIVCTLRYKNNRYVALERGAHRVADEFAEHAAEEETHQSMVAERIAQLGSIPDFNPASLTDRSHASYTTSSSLVELLQENLVAERVAIGMYSEIVRWLANDDPTTRRMMEEILAQEEEHADDLVDLIERVRTQPVAPSK